MDRLFELLRNSGIPAQYLVGANQNDVSVVYSSDPSDETKAQVAKILAEYDWSDEAEQKWREDKKKAEIVERINGDEAAIVIIRNSQKIVFNAIVALIGKVNQVVEAHNTKTGDNIESFPAPSDWNTLLEQVKYLIHQDELGG